MFKMNWKSTILCCVVLYVHASTQSAHGSRIPPRYSRTSKIAAQNATEAAVLESAKPDVIKINATQLEEMISKVAKTSLAEEEPKVAALQNAQISTASPFMNRRLYTNTHNAHKSLISKSNANQTATAQTAAKPSAKNIGSTKYNSNTDDYDTLHMGVAVPLTAEDLEDEISNGVPSATNVQSKPIETSTPKSSLSTWFVDLNEHRVTPTPTPTHKEAKIEKVQKPRVSTTIKPKFKPSSVSNAAKPLQKASQKPSQKPTQTKVPNKAVAGEETVKKVQKSNQDKSASTPKPKPAASKPMAEALAKKIVKKASAILNAANKTPTTKAQKTTTTTTTTEVSEPITEMVETTQEPPSEVSSTTIESTTFLIMEPKDADFDIPADRSPGITKKPKKSKTKKNKNKTELGKKPSKPTTNANKEKPLTTKIYNYLAREVMPTVGMGLVGLTVAAGLATYFLSPFGALRRSYEITDRKDELPPFANDEYAPKEAGASTDEENYSQMVAPNSPYRNSIRYTLRQTGGPNMGPRPMGKFVQGPPPPQYRVRNVAPQNYPAISQPHYNNYQQPNPLQRRDQYPQQYYRYTNEPQDANIYRQSTYLQAYQEQQEEKEKLIQQQLLQQQQKQQQQQIPQPETSIKLSDSITVNQPDMPMDSNSNTDQSMDDSYFPEGGDSSQQYYANHRPTYSDMQPSFGENSNLQPGLVFSENPYKDMTSTSMQINSADDVGQSEPEKSLQTESNNLPMIVTPEPNSADNIMITSDNHMPEDNVLRRRSQFIVGQTIKAATGAEANGEEADSKSTITVDAVPEHGPRRRRRRDVAYPQDVSENEIESHNQMATGHNSFNSMAGNMKPTTPRYPPIRNTLQPFRPLTTLMTTNSNNSFANMFNGFLRSATRAVQTTMSEISAVIPKYLRAFERLINELRIISNHAISNNNTASSTQQYTVQLDKNPQAKSAAPSSSASSESASSLSSSSSASSAAAKTHTNQH